MIWGNLGVLQGIRIKKVIVIIIVIVILTIITPRPHVRRQSSIRIIWAALGTRSCFLVGLGRVRGWGGGGGDSDVLDGQQHVLWHTMSK